MEKELIESKIFFEKEDAAQPLNRWRFAQKKMVFTNGCFDLLHAGHIDLLLKASQLGEVLLVGLNSDRSVKELKGKSRPINSQNARAIVLASLKMVDGVFIFDEATPEELIKFIQPDVLVKGADYTPDRIAGAEFIKSKGGEVVTIALVEGYSTSAIERKIIDDAVK